MKICKVSDCDKPHCAKGYCQMHYRQVRRYGHILSEEEKAQHRRKGSAKRIKTRGLMSTEGKCKVDGCEKDINCKSYCQRHYTQIQRYGRVLTDEEISRHLADNSASYWEQNSINKGQVCKTFDCSNPAKCGGLCNACYLRFLKKKLRMKAIRYLGDRCIDCGLDNIEQSFLFTFHHENPALKSHQINTMITALMPWPAIKEELDKCVLLCCNCHRKRHSGEAKGKHHQRKERAVVYLGGKCQNCGLAEKKALGVYDFHHRNPSTKEYNMAQLLDGRGWEQVRAELDKCILVCANCHLKIHNPLAKEL